MGEEQIVDRGSNSYRSKEIGKVPPHAQNEERLQPVIKGEAKLQKKSAIRKFREAFITEDIHTIKRYILTDVLVPQLKNMLLGSVSAFLFPNGGGPSTLGQNVVRSSGIAYNKITSLRPASAIGSVNQNASYDFAIPTYQSYEDAEYVLEKMREIIDSGAGSVSFLQLYDISKIREIPINCDRFGWRDLRFAKIEPYGGEWTLRLPKALPL
jgi:hypothetical protein